MLQGVYTLGVWRVKAGREAEFIAAWNNLGLVFAQLAQPPSGRGTPIQSVGDPLLFYSFGPWKRLEDIEAMRAVTCSGGDPSPSGALHRGESRQLSGRGRIVTGEDLCAPSVEEKDGQCEAA